MIERFSTEEIQPHKRLDYWNSLCDKTLSGTMVDSPADAFSASMLHWKLGDLTLLRPRSDASRIWRTPAPWSCASDRLVLHIQHRGSGLYTNKHHDASIKPGNLILTDANEGYQFSLSQDHELLVIEMPMQPLRSRLPQLEQHLDTSIGGAPATHMFQDFVLSLWRHGEMAAQCPVWKDEVTRSVYDLLAMALSHRSETTQEIVPGSSQSLLRRARAFIESNLSSEELGASLVAKHLNISVRTVQNLFALTATTPSSYIQERRLIHAADSLRTRLEISITEIAFELGFSDSAYFSRAFRRKYGVSPRQWRSCRE